MNTNRQLEKKRYLLVVDIAQEVLCYQHKSVYLHRFVKGSLLSFGTTFKYFVVYVHRDWPPKTSLT